VTAGGQHRRRRFSWRLHLVGAKDVDSDSDGPGEVRVWRKSATFFFADLPWDVFSME
jgi:hypothetical protein